MASLRVAFHVRAPEVRPGAALGNRVFESLPRAKLESQGSIRASRASRPDQHAPDEIANARLFAGSRPSHVEHLDDVVVDEAAERLVRANRPAIPRQVEDRLALLVRRLDGLLRVARQGRGDREDHGAVAAARVPFRALDAAAPERFLELLAGVDGGVIGFAPSRASAGVRDAALDGEAQAGPVCARSRA
jgi:hypothetical protein